MIALDLSPEVAAIHEVAFPAPRRSCAGNLEPETEAALRRWELQLEWEDKLVEAIPDPEEDFGAFMDYIMMPNEQPKRPRNPTYEHLIADV